MLKATGHRESKIMSKLIRLDKFLSEMKKGTRKEIKEAVKRGRITVNGDIVKNADLKINPDTDTVCFDNAAVKFARYEYFIMNKPQGVISATKDEQEQTVIDLIQDNVRSDLFPVGRLDKDTEGLLLITNNGDLAHRLLSPSRHVKKIYYAKIEGIVTEDDKLKFSKGITLSDGTITKPASLKILVSAPISEIELTIYEGKYHQVKRMFAACGKHVLYLKRICMGNLYLDKELKTGEYRQLTENELDLLCGDWRQQ